MSRPNKILIQSVQYNWKLIENACVLNWVHRDKIEAHSKFPQCLCIPCLLKESVTMFYQFYVLRYFFKAMIFFNRTLTLLLLSFFLKIMHRSFLMYQKMAPREKKKELMNTPHRGISSERSFLISLLSFALLILFVLLSRPVLQVSSGNSYQHEIATY